jgi:ABC-type multidrug transport system fused ATPase/permease subunit
MKEKINELNQPLASDSDSNLGGGETSELEDIDVMSSELGERDSTKSFNEEEFYKEKTSFLSQLFFCWTSPLFQLSKLKNINIQSLKRTKKTPYNSSINCKDLYSPYYNLIEYYNSPTSKTYHRLLFSILRVNILDELIVLSLSLTLTFLGIYRVNVFRRFMGLFETSNDKNFYPKSLYSLSALLLFVRLSQILILHFNDFLCEKLCNKTRAQLTTFIYNKILITSLFIKSHFNRGRIINFLQSDIETINFLFFYAPMTLVVPFQITANMIILFRLFGISFLWSFCTFIALITIAWLIEYFYIKTKKKLLKNNDDRIKTTSSILQNIKVIKMYTYESLFYNILKRKRENEMNNYKRIENIFVLTDFIHWLIPLFLSVVSVGVEAFTNDEISIENIIVAIDIYDSLAYPLYRIPIFMASLLNTLLSMKRLEDFLNEENIEETKGKIKEEQEAAKLNRYIKYRDDDQYSIIIENTDFGIKGKKKEEDKILLNDINIKIKKGSIVGILGETGSGKTNLVYGILRHFNTITDSNEDIDFFTTSNNLNYGFNDKKMVSKDINNNNNNEEEKSIELSNSFSSDEQEKKLERKDSELKTRSAQRMVINGTISYACQTPFVINDTIKNNIEFFNKDNLAKFWKVIEVCQLSDDLKLFPSNEYSEVSPGGSNLSGGQKARICLARAVYNDADIYILDDPISSVDPIVFNKIYGSLLLNYLKDKTRIVLQHDQNFIQHMEYIYYINEGKIVFSGTYNEFINTKWYKKMTNKEATHIEKILENSDTKLTVHKWKRLPSRKMSIEGGKVAFIERGKVVEEESTQKGGIKFSLYKK